MSLFPCSSCGQRLPGKLSSATWAWFRSDGERVAYRQRLCLTCVATNVAPLEVETREWSLNCPACHIDASDDLDPVYLTLFVPGTGRIALELPMCPRCAVEVRNRAQQGGERLESREFGGQDPGPQTNTESGWAALGIQPR
jgi:hypothetical protein